jgi:hypothetical protein
MPIKVDGTNGVLQAYDYQTPSTGFSYTFAAGTQTLIANPAGTLATGTVTMPAAPADGMVITVESTQQITALTVQGNTGQSLVGGTVTLRQNQPLSYVYRLTNTTWYPFAGNSNSDIVSGTSQNSTSGTSIDFTSIPSWVKRITVMFSGVSTSGTSQILCQIGSGGITSTGYTGTCTGFSTGGSTVSMSTGFILGDSTRAGDLRYGLFTIANHSGNLWAMSGVIGITTGITATTYFGGTVTIGGVLDRVRITTAGGTDTFDAGSINILYE